MIEETSLSIEYLLGGGAKKPKYVDPGTAGLEIVNPNF
jgi:hypothetical protein